ncbi:hypothetical protein AK812_SmicGene46245, partial [Symbiodinium microadriaticum]
MYESMLAQTQVAAQCDHPPENLVRLLKPNGILVCPVGPVVPIDSKHPG